MLSTFRFLFVLLKTVRNEYSATVSQLPFLYFLFRKGQNAGPSTAAQRYEDAMRFGSPAEKIREATRHTVRELFAFWILGFIVLMFALPTPPAAPIMPGYDFAIPSIFWPVLLVDTVLFAPAWLLYRLIRFAIAR